MTDFPSTQWSFVTELRAANAAEKQPLIEQFLLRYLPPMRAFLSWKMHWLGEHDREDLLHDFVTDQILQRSLIEWAHREKGKLRSFLSRSLQNHAVSWCRASRVAAATPMSQLGDLPTEPAGDPSGVDEFDVAWCRHVLSEAVVKMKDECHDSGRQLMWDVFDLRIMRPLISPLQPPSYRELEARLGAGEKQLANLLTSAKHLLRRKVRDVVGGYVEDPAELKQEVHDLFVIAAACGGLPGDGEGGDSSVVTTSEVTSGGEGHDE